MESGIRKFRSKAQRLNTYGVWFLETAQHNPAQTIGKFMLNSLRVIAPPYGTALATFIAVLVSSAYVIPQTIKNLSKKGLPFNIDWHRNIAGETVGFFTLEEQKRRDLGLAGVIVDPTTGYRPVDGTEVYNTRQVADTIRLTKLTQEEKARRLY